MLIDDCVKLKNVGHLDNQQPATRVFLFHNEVDEIQLLNYLNMPFARPVFRDSVFSLLDRSLTSKERNGRIFS